MSKLASYLVRSRHGIYYLRETSGGKERRISLRTRDPLAARMAAYHFGAVKMAGDNNLSGWKIKTNAQGLEIETDGSAEDHTRALEALRLALDKMPGAFATSAPQ